MHEGRLRQRAKNLTENNTDKWLKFRPLTLVSYQNVRQVSSAEGEAKGKMAYVCLLQEP
jgi:hypothetical protein